jgi:arylsulfatase A-like enzyme
MVRSDKTETSTNSAAVAEDLDSAEVGPAVTSSVFWPAVWLTIMIVAIKGSYVELATFWQWATPPWDYLSLLYLQWFAAASQADTLFALITGLLGGVLFWLARGKWRLARAVYISFLIFGVICVIYAVVGRQIFSYYSAPLTYQLLLLGGEPSRLWSSLNAFVTPGAAFAIVASPTAYLYLVTISRKLDAFASKRVRYSVCTGLLMLTAAWLALGQQLIGSVWFMAQDRHFKDSAHQVFVQSVMLSITNNTSDLGTTAVAAEDFIDFQPTPSSSLKTRDPMAWANSAGSRPKNVILIVLESVGSRYLGLYGNTLDTTPRLLREQDNALVFDRYYAPVGWTAYSLLSLVMAQRPPMERYNELSFRVAALDGASVTNVLADSGYRTAFMSAGDPDWASAGFLEGNGFADVQRGNDLTGAPQISSWGTQDRYLFDAMLAWINKHASEPFFLMAWTDQTHHPYKVAPGQKLIDVLPPEQAKDKPDLANYVSLIREADTQIGRLLDGLRQLEIADDTLVIITGDHGESFGKPHGGRGHGFTVYDEEVRVPLMIWNPSLFTESKRVSTVGSHTDLAPTILDLLGIPAPEGWDGRSMFDTSRSPRTYLFAAAWGQYLLGVRDGEFKYIYDARIGKEELYNLLEDPDELRNLADSNPKHASELRRRLAAWVEIEQQRSAVRRKVEPR